MSRVVIVGCGLIGRKRAEAIRELGIDTITGFCDVDSKRAKGLTVEFGGKVFTDYEAMFASQEADIAVIATNHKMLPAMSLAALEAGMHVLAEKPLGRNAKEVEPVVELADQKKLIYKCGFNHRYFPGLLQAKAMVGEGKIGELMYVRARYGHGGRPGYDKEWRAVPEIAGGGELLDQGIHLVDLARWFLGDFETAMGVTQTAYWDMPLEDNGFAILRTAKKQTAFLHASWTQWKNIFSFEVFGKDGYISIDGLVKSYGPQKLTWARRRPESGPPIIETYDFPDEDHTWTLEWEDLKRAIDNQSQPLGTGHDGWEALKLIDKIYAAERA